MMNEAMSYKQGKYVDLLDRFAESEYGICEVNINDEKLSKDSVLNLASRIRETARRFGKPHIRVISNKGKVYLINKLKG